MAVSSASSSTCVSSFGFPKFDINTSSHLPSSISHGNNSLSPSTYSCVVQRSLIPQLSLEDHHFHACMEVWTPTIGAILLVKSEPTNCQDSKAVAILKENVTVGHVPQNIAPRLFHFLRRDVNKAFAEVTGHKVNRGAGYGLEIPFT